MKQTLFVACLALLAMPARAAHLSGSYDVPITYFGFSSQDLCVRLVSSGAQGIYQDQGSASMLIKSSSQTHYEYLGQYQLYQHHLSLVLSNYGKYDSTGYLLTADIKKKQWTNGLVFTYLQARKREGASNGTFSATRFAGSCK